MALVTRAPVSATRQSVLAGAPSIQYQRQEFTISEAITYYEYTLEAILAAEDSN